MEMKTEQRKKLDKLIDEVMTVLANFEDKEREHIDTFPVVMSTVSFMFAKSHAAILMAKSELKREELITSFLNNARKNILIIYNQMKSENEKTDQRKTNFIHEENENLH